MEIRIYDLLNFRGAYMTANAERSQTTEGASRAPTLFIVIRFGVSGAPVYIVLVNFDYAGSIAIALPAAPNQYQ